MNRLDRRGAAKSVSEMVKKSKGYLVVTFNDEDGFGFAAHNVGLNSSEDGELRERVFCMMCSETAAMLNETEERLKVLEAEKEQSEKVAALKAKRSEELAKENA